MSGLMGGWKTWTGAVGLVLMGISAILDGNPDAGIMRIVEALALVGIGHKLEKK
jgi:hypothetical protein